MEKRALAEKIRALNQLRSLGEPTPIVRIASESLRDPWRSFRSGFSNSLGHHDLSSPAQEWLTVRRRSCIQISLRQFPLKRRSGHRSAGLDIQLRNLPS